MERKYKVLVPNGWPCTLRDAPEGMFVTMENMDLICFKSEYRNKGGTVMALNSGGEYFCSGDDTMVQPIMLQEIEV